MTKRTISIIFLIFLAIAVNVTGEERQEDVIEGSEIHMEAIYQPYLDLLYYLNDKSSFVAQENEESVRQLFKELFNESRHLNRLAEDNKNLLGYNLNVSDLIKRVKNTQSNFESGNKDFAYSQLNTIESSCVGCHVMFEIDQDFRTHHPLFLKADLEISEYYISTAQFIKAEQYLKKAIDTVSDNVDLDRSLRLYILTLVLKTSGPEQIISDLNDLIDSNSVRFSTNQLDMLNGWIKAMQEWKQEAHSDTDLLLVADMLIKRGKIKQNQQKFYSAEIDLLRAAELLHKLNRYSKLNSGKRNMIVCHLGEAYASLRNFFRADLATGFLKMCIANNPESVRAQQAYERLAKIVKLGYMGSSGLRLPEDVKKELVRYKDLAFSD